MKKYYVINEDEAVFGPASRNEAELEAERLRELAIDKKLDDWGYDPDDCSDKKIAEAAWAVGADGDLFEVLEAAECDNLGINMQGEEV